MFAPYTLVRGALENGCATVWLLQPRRRVERITGRLQFAVSDIRHGEEVKRLTGNAGPRTKAERLKQVGEIADRCGADRAAVMKPPGYGDIVKMAARGNDGFVVAWRLCSGIAHGDFWTTPAASVMVQLPGSEQWDVGTYSASANLSMLASMTTLAVLMTAEGWRLHDVRSLAP